MASLVLLGDSIFDNGAYVGAGGAVIDELRRAQWVEEATLLARDGAVISGVLSQLPHVPATASHLFISAGGNDALRDAGVLTQPVTSVAEALAQIEVVRDRFAAAYSQMLDAVAELKLQTAVCTIYDVQFPDPFQRRISNLALGFLNDIITRQAVKRRLPVLDLRVLFDDPADYANAIEPSAQGSRKMAAAIAGITLGHDFSGPSSSYAF